MNRLVLFDIDHTLIHIGDAGVNAMDHAMQKTLNELPASIKQIRYDGKTDKQIITEVLQLNGIARERIEAVLHEVVNNYLASLPMMLDSEAELKISPGARELLQDLHQDEHVVMGLLTGNMQRGARLKLSYFDLNSYFPFGAFGSDSMNRKELVPFAVERAKREVGKEFSEKEITVIGDSIHDINCGKPHNVKTIGIATGFTSIEELKSVNPDYVFPDLTHKTDIINAIKQ